MPTWALALGLAALCAPAFASPMLIGASSDGTIYDVDPLTGAATNPRDTGIDSLYGIAFSADGTLYGGTVRSDSQPSSLFTIEAATGASTLVGYIGRAAYDIAFDPTSGILYAFGDTTGMTGEDLYTIDVVDATPTVVGHASVERACLAFDEFGALYVLDSDASTGDALLTLDKYTAETLSTVLVSADLGVAAMEFLPSGIPIVSTYGWNSPNVVYALDVSTGVLTEIGPTGVEPGLVALAWVPEPGSLLLLAVGSLFLARRRQCSSWRTGPATGIPRFGCCSPSSCQRSGAILSTLLALVLACIQQPAQATECSAGEACGESVLGELKEETGLGGSETLLFSDVMHGDFVTVGESTRIWIHRPEPGPETSPQTDPLTLIFEGIPDGASIVRAYVNWSYQTYDLDAPTIQQITISSVPVTGVRTGEATPDLCWYWPGDDDYPFTASFTADVTDIVTSAGGNGTYLIGGAVDDPVAHALAEGISLLVVYEKADEPLREIKVYTGLTQTESNPDENYTRANLELGANPYIGGPVHLFINTLDGEESADAWLDEWPFGTVTYFASSRRREGRERCSC